MRNLFTTLMACSLLSILAPQVHAGNGACCLENGNCTQTSFEECVFGGGIWLGGESCIPGVNCFGGDPVGACCLDDGTCLDGILFSQCEGTHFANQMCGNVTCIAIGACCLPEGNECFEVSENDCNLNGGTYQGDGTVCALVNCTDPVGACCVEEIDGTFSCSDNTPLSQCFGTFTPNASCANVACPPMGACCFTSGCVESGENDCNNNGGDYQGDGTVCTPGLCPDPQGACCIDLGDNVFTCTEGPASQCNGTFFIGGRCSSIACPPEGACCLPAGGCQVISAADCAAAGGTFLDGGVCNDCPPTGACCEGATCTQRPENICVALGGEYQGDNTGCGTANCAVCPCNLGDDDVVDVLDLLEFLSLWFPSNGMNVPPGTAGDYDGSGTVDVLDLLAFLACWFPASNGEACP